MSEKNTLPTSPTSSSAPSAAIIQALKRLLRPLVRLLLKFQITLPFLVELLKETYVDVAEKDFPIEGKKQTDTRISMLTGVHRKDTKRLRGQDQPAILDAQSIEKVSIGVQLVNKWLNDPLFTDSTGEPKRLPLKAASDSTDTNFEALVQSVCKQDMRARVILDEWLRLGLVSLSDDDCVTLESKGFIPAKGQDEKAFYLGMNIADHIEAVSQNIVSDTPPFLERCLYYDGLSAESVKVLEAEARAKGMALLQELNKSALALREQDAANEKVKPKDKEQSSSEAHRINLGLYFFNEPDTQDKDNA